MDSITKELVAIIIQHLDAFEFHEAARTLERESGIFFNLKYFEEKVRAGEWEEVEKYLLGFTGSWDNDFSTKFLIKIRKQKYLEALDRKDKASAADILIHDLKVFSSYDGDMYREMWRLFFMDNLRDAPTSRREMLIDLKKLLESNPNFHEKLIFPSLSPARLLTMLNQSVNMQHSLCENQMPFQLKTLFLDHVCEPVHGSMASTSLLVSSAAAYHNAYPSLGVKSSIQAALASSRTSGLENWSGSDATSLFEPPIAAAPCLPVLSNQAALRHIDNPSIDHDPSSKRLRLASSSDEGPSLQNLPRIVACILHQGSAVTSMDFHPTHHTLLLVGSANGEVILWELRTEQKVASKPFKIWNMCNHSPAFWLAVFASNMTISVTRALWSPDGGFIGVAFNKHLIHLYAYAGLSGLQQLLEVEAHNGLVSDMAFLYPQDHLCIATCGEDKLVKVWELNGQMLYSFEGHQAPIYSICPNQYQNIKYILSTSVDGMIKLWLYPEVGSRAEFIAPGLWCTTLLYSDDRRRLFSCGTSIEGNSFLIEWNEEQAKIIRTYHGSTKNPPGTVVHFDTTQNQYLAVGEDKQIKFWDMDNINILTSTQAGGGLPSQPRLKFNKKGNLLAVSTTDDGFKILATPASLRFLRSQTASTSKVEGSSIDTAIDVDDSNVTRPPSQQTLTPNHGGRAGWGTTIFKRN